MGSAALQGQELPVIGPDSDAVDRSSGQSELGVRSPARGGRGPRMPETQEAPGFAQHLLRLD
eukprot:14438406-Alexandrium_andersonii.AAC.1